MTQLVANSVFPRESVFGLESKGKHATSCELGFFKSVLGLESIGKHKTQLVAKWFFLRESVFGLESAGKRT